MAKKATKSNWGKLTAPQTLNERTLCEGNVVLFKRANSKKWQYRIRQRQGRWHCYSTKQGDIDEASRIAEENYRDLKYREKTGKLVVTRRFSDVCKVAKRELMEEYENTGRLLAKNYIQVIDKYLIPILGKYQSHNIVTETLIKYAKEREKIMGRVPTKSTANTHTSALNYVLRKAMELGYIEFIPNTPKQLKFATDKRRSYFSNIEYRALTNFMWRDLEDSKKRLREGGTIGNYRISWLTYEIRELLRDVVLILANTGIRAGEELLNLKWNNLDVVEQDGLESIRFALIHTKTRQQRRVIGYEPIQKDKD